MMWMLSASSRSRCVRVRVIGVSFIVSFVLAGPGLIGQSARSG